MTTPPKRISLCLPLLIFAGCASAASRPATSNCGSKTAKAAKQLTWAVEKMTVDGDTSTQHTLKLPAISPAVWVTDEVVCTKVLATIDTLWPKPRGGPVYVIRLGRDYVVVQGTDPNGSVMHVDASFNYIVSIVWQ